MNLNAAVVQHPLKTAAMDVLHAELHLLDDALHGDPDAGDMHFEILTAFQEFDDQAGGWLRRGLQPLRAMVREMSRALRSREPPDRNNAAVRELEAIAAARDDSHIAWHNRRVEQERLQHGVVPAEVMFARQSEEYLLARRAAAWAEASVHAAESFVAAASPQAR